MDYININVAINLVIPIPGSSSGDTVTYQIIAVSDGDVLASGSMTFLADEMWKVSYTPTETGVIVLKVTDSTISSKRENIYDVIGTVVTASGVSGDDLSTLANVKEYLRITDTNDDTLLQKILTRTSEWIQKYCNRTFIATTYTEYYDGDGSNELLLDQFPVNSITSCYDDTDREYGADTAITVTDLIIKDAGLIVYDDGFFNKGDHNIKITYNAGYTTIPADLELACIKLVASEYLLGQGAINVVEGVIVDKPKRFKDEAMKVINYYRKGSMC